MRVMHRRISSATAVLLVSLLLGATASRAGVAAEDRDRPAQDPALAAAASSAPPDMRRSPALDATPEVRPLIEEFTGSEPDPTAFDQRGLDLWWLHYQEKLQRPE